MKTYIRIVIAILLVISLSGCVDGTQKENDEQETAAPTPMMTEQVTPTPEPTTIPPEETESEELLFGLTAVSDRYSKDIDIIELTIRVPEDTVSWGAYAPMLDKRTDSGWEAVDSEVGYCEAQEEMTNGSVIELMMELQYPNIEAGSYRVYLDIYSDLDPDNANRVYAEFELVEE